MKKKIFIGLSIGCTALLVGAATLALTHNNMLKVKAGTNERTLVLDGNLPVTIQGLYGSSDIGMMSVSTYQVSQLEGGYANCKFLCVYYPGYISGIGTYGGFQQSTVTSVSVSYKVTEASTMTVKWGGVRENGSLISTSNADYYTEQSLTVSDSIQTFTVSAGSNFIDNQVAGKNTGFPSVFLGGSGVVSVYSVTINYTCL